MMMRPNSIAREPKVFGDEFVDHFGGTRMHEVRLWNEAVTSWEGCLYPLLHSIHPLDILFSVERYLELA